MAAKIKRCLYVGLGGTGMTSLLHTKKMFIETYGEVPPMIGFLGLDTDGGAYNRDLTSKCGKVVLDPNEQQPIQVEDAAPIYRRNKAHMTWLPPENEYALVAMKLGAGQIRTNGRFALICNYRDVENKIKQCISDITNAQIVNNTKYQLISNDIEIHLVFSVSGGTGCGTFLDMAYLLRDVAGNCKLTGYAVLPDVFENMSNVGMAKVKPNAYGAITDLDYFMHQELSSSVEFDYITTTKEFFGKPFNAFFFVDNKNKQGDTYTHVDQLAEMISLAMVTAAGELSAANASVSDNLEKNIREGNMDVDNKKAWAAGLGVCQIMFRGADLSDIYAMKAVKRLIEKLINNNVDTDNIVNNWIDKPEVNIRENNGQDNVIDFVLEKKPRVTLTSIEDNSNPRPEIDVYLQASKSDQGSVDSKIDTLQTRVVRDLKCTISEELNKDCGVGAAKKIINGIKAQVDIFMGEMRAELQEITDKKPRLENSLKSRIADLQECDSKFFKKKSTLKDLAEDVMTAAIQIAINEREEVRRLSAIRFYTALQTELGRQAEKVSMIEETFATVNASITNKLAAIQNRVGRNTQIFQIDLASMKVNTVVVNEEETSVAELVKALPLSMKVDNFNTLNAQEVENMLFNYAKKLPTADKWNDTTIDSIINEMDQGQLETILRLAIAKASPLLTIDEHGYTQMEKPADCYFIGVPNKLDNRLKNNDLLKSLIQGSPNIDFASIGNNDTIIIYHQIGVIPAFFIAPLDSYEERYKRMTRPSCHFDDNIKRSMDRNEYSVRPTEAADETLDTWIKGLLFGRIKNEGGKYQYVDEENGEAIDDYWLPLSEYRDDSYEMFRKVEPQLRAKYSDIADCEAKRRGNEAMEVFLHEVRENYLDKFSQVNLTRDDLKKKGMERVKSLLNNEIDYVRKELH